MRASISFPPDLYETLEGIAKQKKVSLAWVVRDASERYATDEAGKSENRRKRTGTFKTNAKDNMTRLEDFQLTVRFFFSRYTSRRFICHDEIGNS